jgi:hypothetical protein
MDENNIITDYVGDGSIYLRVDRPTELLKLN